MFFSSIVNNGPLPALEKLLAFTQARHRMLTENVANIDTPHYKTKQLDAKAFQQALGKALEKRRETRSPELKIEASGQFRQDRLGRLVVNPTVEPAENILFHDQTNARVERQMALLAENGMMHQVATELLRGRFEGLLKAISGRVS